jgi:hypothetical protein
MKNLTITHIVFIVQSSLILILFFIVIFKKKPEPILFDYNRIKVDMEQSIKSLEENFISLSKENAVLYNMIDSFKMKIPNNKRSLRLISQQIKELNETYIINNYRDSSDAALLRRLSGDIGR